MRLNFWQLMWFQIWKNNNFLNPKKDILVGYFWDDETCPTLILSIDNSFYFTNHDVNGHELVSILQNSLHCKTGHLKISFFCLLSQYSMRFSIQVILYLLYKTIVMIKFEKSGFIFHTNIYDRGPLTPSRDPHLMTVWKMRNPRIWLLYPLKFYRWNRLILQFGFLIELVVIVSSKNPVNVRQ